MFHLVKVSDAKQPAIGVALLTAAKFNSVPGGDDADISRVLHGNNGRSCLKQLLLRALQT